MSFFEDLKRRNVFRVAAAYAVVAWLVIQVVETLTSIFPIGDTLPRVVVIVLAIGFPIALLFSWVYEFTSDGLKLERDIDHSHAGTQRSGRLLDRMIIVVLVIALGYFVIDKFYEDDPSIAVLPFEDMSPNGDQAYFGIGMADQLISDLVPLDGLRVAPRTSIFMPNGAKKSFSEIAEALNVSTILDGSIRKDGDRIRITAQLINISDNEILWSDIYDRKFEKIFDIQIEIATKVTGKLGVTLDVGGVNAFRGAGTRNIEAYEEFLKAPKVFGSEVGIRHLKRAIELDPNYAAAWSWLSFATLTRGMNKYPGENRENEKEAYALVLRAIELNSELANANNQLGVMLQVEKDWIRAEEAHLKALSLRVDSPNLNRYAGLFLRTGHSAAALEQYDKAEALEPSTGLQIFHFDVAMPQGRFDDARTAWARRPNHLPIRGGDLTIALHQGDSKEIKAILAAKQPDELSTIELYGPVLKVFDSPEIALSKLREVYADNDSRWPSKLTDIGLLAAYFGDEELALQTIGEEARLGSNRFGVVWYPLMADVRELQGFKDLVTEMNLVAYWRAREWPEKCRPVGADDFECF